MKEMYWTWKEFIILVGIALVFVPVVMDELVAAWVKNLVENELFKGTLMGLLLAILLTISTYLIALRPFHFSWKEVGVVRFKTSHWKRIIFWTILYIALGILYIIGLEMLGFGTDNSKTESVQNNKTFLGFIIAFLSAAVISPIYEEIFYRGFIYTWLRQRFSIWPSVITSSFIFMLVHIPTYNTLVFNFFGAFILAWLYEKTESIVPSMIVHATFNGLAVVLTFLF